MAGKGTRWAKHFEGPKQLTLLAGKPILEHVLDALPRTITELIFVVGGPHEQRIREYFNSNNYQGIPITFVVQEQQLGLAHAFRCAMAEVVGSSTNSGLRSVRWLGMVADDIYGVEGLRKLVQYDLALLASRVEHPENFGVLVTDSQDDLVRAVEKPREFISDFVWNGAMVMDASFFDIEIQPSARGEYETPDVWMKLLEQGKKIKVVEADFWLPINDKAQFEEAERLLSNR